MDALHAAIMAAGAELGDVHQWLFEEGASAPEEGDVFITVIAKHVAPLLGGNYKAARIAALRAELAVLEES